MSEDLADNIFAGDFMDGKSQIKTRTRLDPSTHSADVIRVGMVLYGVGAWFLREIINMQVVGGS